MEFIAPEPQAKNYRRMWLYVGLGLCVVLLSCVVGYIISRDKPTTQPAQTASVQQVQQQAPDFTSVEGRYLFNGTIVLARAVEKYARGDYAQPFSQLNTFNREQYDAWYTDFECPITPNIVPYEQQINNLVFNCRPEWLPEMTKYVNIYNLANNHTDNQGGQVGLTQTRDYLQKAGVQYFGNYDPTITQDICEVLALHVRAKKADGSEQKQALPVAFCGWHYFNYNRGPSQAELDVVKQYAERMPVFGFVEMGNEYQAKASQFQRDIAYKIIDVGADFVFANNPHWVQDSEVYKGKLIVYSLGNFIFDQIDAETQRGVSIDTKMTLSYDDNVAQWLALGESCAVYKDDCLQQAQQKGLKKVQAAYYFVPIANQNGAQKITRKANDQVQKAVEERLNWTTVSKQLGQ